MKTVYLLLCLLCAGSVAANGLTVRKIYGPEEISKGATGLRSTFSGGKLSGRLLPGRFSDGSPCGVWELTGEGGKGNWSCLGFQFPGTADAAPVGFRLELEAQRGCTLNIEPRHNAVPEKGFWNSRRLGRNLYSLAAGRQTLEVNWADLKTPAKEWPGINAVVLSAAEPQQLRIGEFSLLYPPHTETATPTANWFDADRNRINPVARPFDKLTSVFCRQSRGGWVSLLDEGPHPETGRLTPYWGAEAPKGNPNGAATYGFGFADRIDPAPAGVDFTVTLLKPAELSIQPVTNFNERRTKGFYSAKNAGKPRKFQLRQGTQTLRLIWTEFGLPQKTAEQVNGVKFTGLGPGNRMFFDRIDLRFGDPASAHTYRSVSQQRLKTLQRVLTDSLAARGIDWRKTLDALDTAAAEPLIWQGIQLAAQREQLDFFRRLAAANRLDAGQFNALEQQRDTLAARGAAGQFDSQQEQVDALQQQIDTAIDAVLAKLPPEKRRFRYDASDRQFHYPDGRFYRMYGPHFFRSQYRPGPQEWRKWDLRYLAGLGFNGIRVQIRWAQLEPVRGQFEPGYLALLKGIFSEAERYGFGVSVDLHWAYPEWFNAGKPGYQVAPKSNPHNSYHWPDALIDTWERLGKELAACPNIVAFEVPTNETNICASPNSFHDYPYLLKLWNEFLKEKYRTRDALHAAWSAAGEQYGLAPGENWDDHTIRPLGFQNDRTVEEAYLHNPRVYDHLQFTARMQRQVSGDIVRALRKSIPDAYGMFQRTIGDVWDRSPVPLDYLSVITCVGDNVLPGTHYGMGSVSARKAATLTLGSYDSEQQMEGNSRAVERHVALGLGFCPFAFHYRGGGGMLLADDDWHLKPEVGYLPKMAEKIRNSVPARRTGPAVALIVNSRLEATTGRLTGNLPEALEKSGCRVGVFDSLRIVSEPALLDSYETAVTTSSYLDPELLDILRNFSGKVLFFGRLDIDSYARTQAAGLPGALAERGLFLKERQVRNAGSIAGTIDLAGSWEFVFRPSDVTPPQIPKDVTAFESVKAPGMWGEVGLTGSLKYRIGDGWYRRTVTLPPDWKGRPLRLRIGAVDDIDWVFWNGRLIGKTGEEVPNYWQTPRNYEIPAERIRYDRPNELYICVRNLRGNGGIPKGPLMLTARSSGQLRFTDGALPGGCTETGTLLTTEQLTPDTAVLATFKVPGQKDGYPALLRQGKMFWYFKDLEFNAADPADRKALDTVLAAE